MHKLTKNNWQNSYQTTTFPWHL